MKKTITRILTIGLMFVMSLVVLSGCGDKFPERHPEQEKIAGFHSLETAYEKGWLSKTDLKNIAYFFNNGNDDENFAPSPKEPEVLSAETITAIKQMYLEIFLPNIEESFHHFDLEHPIDGVHIGSYFGGYNNGFTITIRSDYILVDPLPSKDHKIAGILFKNYSLSFSIQFWHES